MTVSSEVVKDGLPPGPRSLVPGWLIFPFRKNPLGFITEMKKKYGEFFYFRAFNRRLYIATNAEIAKEVLLTQADAFWKTPALRKTKRFFGEGLLTSEGDVHRGHRRLMQPAFHAKYVEVYTDDILHATADMCDGWRKDGQQARDVHPEMMRLTLIIAAKTLFGTILDDETHAIGEAMETLVAGTQRTLLPWGKILDKLPLPSSRRVNRADKLFKGVCDRIIGEHRKALADGRPMKRDLLSTMIEATDTGSDIPAECPHSKKAARLTDSELRDHAITILAAGHETTANAMTFSLYLLASYPEEQKRLREQVERQLGNRAPTPDDLDAMPRIHWVLSESMRLFPPAWTVGREAQRPVMLGGYHVPAQSIVLIPQFALHRDDRYFPEPDKFLPERWENPTHPRYAYLPFSTGPRNCIGESFAWLEMGLALTTLLQQFEFALADREAPFGLYPAITLRPKHPVNLRITPRVQQSVGALQPI